MLLLNPFLRILFVIDNYFVLFPWTRFIKGLNFFFTKLDFVIFARRTATNGRTLAVYFLTPTIIIFAAFWAVTPVFVNFISIDNNMFFFKSLSINGLGLIYNEVSCILVVFSIKAVSAFTSRTAVAQLFETRTVKSEAVRVLAFAALCCFLNFFLFGRWSNKFRLSSIF